MSKTIRKTTPKQGTEQGTLEPRDPFGQRKSLVQLRRKLVKKIQKSDKNLGRYDDRLIPCPWRTYSILTDSMREKNLEPDLKNESGQRITHDEAQAPSGSIHQIISRLEDTLRVLENGLPKAPTPCEYPLVSEPLGVMSAELELSKLREADSNRPVLAISQDRCGFHVPLAYVEADGLPSFGMLLMVLEGTFGDMLEGIHRLPIEVLTNIYKTEILKRKV